MNELSQRLRQAVDFLKKNGYAGSDAEVAARIGVLKSTFSMATHGSRVPTWDMLLDLCDAYPIDFWWLRTGKGSMIKSERELVLLKRIEELEAALNGLDSACSADPRR